MRPGDSAVTTEKYEELLKVIAAEARAAAGAEMSSPNFVFKCVGEQLDPSGRYLVEVPFKPSQIERLEQAILVECERETSVIKAKMASLEQLYIWLANIRHVRVQLQKSGPSGMCVAIHRGSIRKLKAALKNRLSGTVLYYRPMEKIGAVMEPRRGEWHIVMSDKDGVICKMFELVVPECLSMLALAEYQKPDRFMLVK